MNDQRLFSLKSATMGYDRKEVLSNFSLDVQRGEFLGIVGRNGGGKTTLVKTIIGLIKLKAGSLTFFDTNGLPSSRPSIGYLPQLNKIDRAFPIHVDEVIRSGLIGRRTDKNDESLIRQAATDLDIMRLMKRPISDLSGGELQRVLLSRAIVSLPELLVLDEPNSYLDESTEKLVRQTVNKQHSLGTTILLITHDREGISAQADRILSLD